MRDEAAQAAADAAIATTATKVTYTGAGMTISGWFFSSEFAVLMGVIIGVAGFIVNWYYRHKQDRREQVEHERRMRDYEDPK